MKIKRRSISKKSKPIGLFLFLIIGATSITTLYVLSQTGMLGGPGETRPPRQPLYGSGIQTGTQTGDTVAPMRNQPNVVLQGVVSRDNRQRTILTTEDDNSYLLESDRFVMNQYHNQTASLAGVIKEYRDLPVINVSTIEGTDAERINSGAFRFEWSNRTTPLPNAGLAIQLTENQTIEPVAEGFMINSTITGSPPITVKIAVCDGSYPCDSETLASTGRNTFRSTNGITYRQTTAGTREFVNDNTYYYTIDATAEEVYNLSRQIRLLNDTFLSSYLDSIIPLLCSNGDTFLTNSEIVNTTTNLVTINGLVLNGDTSRCSIAYELSESGLTFTLDQFTIDEGQEEPIDNQELTQSAEEDNPNNGEIATNEGLTATKQGAVDDEDDTPTDELDPIDNETNSSQNTGLSLTGINQGDIPDVNIEDLNQYTFNSVDFTLGFPPTALFSMIVTEEIIAGETCDRVINMIDYQNSDALRTDPDASIFVCPSGTNSDIYLGDAGSYSLIGRSFSELGNTYLAQTAIITDNAS